MPLHGAPSAPARSYGSDVWFLGVRSRKTYRCGALERAPLFVGPLEEES
jgi:hypothetical protein